jgi:hypothetical protein
MDAAYKKENKFYKDADYIKVLNPGDRKSIFISFRWKSSKKEVFICQTEINLDNTDKNVFVRITLLKPKEPVPKVTVKYPNNVQESVTFFKKGLAITHKSITEILQLSVAPLIIEKLKKVENYYGTDSSSNSIR